MALTRWLCLKRRGGCVWNDGVTFEVQKNIFGKIIPLVISSKCHVKRMKCQTRSQEQKQFNKLIKVPQNSTDPHSNLLQILAAMKFCILSIAGTLSVSLAYTTDLLVPTRGPLVIPTTPASPSQLIAPSSSNVGSLVIPNVATGTINWGADTSSVEEFSSKHPTPAFFDTAERYSTSPLVVLGMGWGTTEERFAERTEGSNGAIVGTKFTPTPWRKVRSDENRERRWRGLVLLWTFRWRDNPHYHLLYDMRREFRRHAQWYNASLQKGCQTTILRNKQQQKQQQEVWQGRWQRRITQP